MTAINQNYSKMLSKTNFVVSNIVKQITDHAQKQFQLRFNVNKNISRYSCSKVAVSINQLTTSVFNNPEINTKFIQQTDPQKMALDNMMPQNVQLSVLQKSKSNNTSRMIDSHRTNRSRNKRIVKYENSQKVMEIEEHIKEQDVLKAAKPIKVTFQPVRTYYKIQDQDENVQKFRLAKIQQQNQKRKDLKKIKSLLHVDKNTAIGFDYDGKYIKVNNKSKKHLISASTDARPNRNSLTQVKKQKQIPIGKIKNYKVINKQEENQNGRIKVFPKSKTQNQQNQQIEQPKYVNYQQKNYTDPSVWMMHSTVNSGMKITFQKRTFDNSSKKYSIKDIQENLKSRRLSRMEFKQLKSYQRKYSQTKQVNKKIIKTSQSQSRINNDFNSQNSQIKTNYKQKSKRSYQFKPLGAISKSQKIIVNSFRLKEQLTQIQPQADNCYTNSRSKTQCYEGQLAVQSKLRIQDNKSLMKINIENKIPQLEKGITISFKLKVYMMIDRWQEYQKNNQKSYTSILINSKNVRKVQLMQSLKKNPNKNKQ